MYTQVLIYTHLHSCTASTLMYTTASAARQVPCQTRNPGTTRMLTELSHDGTSLGTVTSSHDSLVDESRREQAGQWYQCLSSKQTHFALGQHAGSPCLRGTRCGVQNSVAELWNVPRAHLATSQAQAMPIYIGKVRRGGLSGVIM